MSEVSIEKPKCADCGKRLSSWTEHHTYDHCEQYKALHAHAIAAMALGGQGGQESE